MNFSYVSRSDGNISLAASFRYVTADEYPETELYNTFCDLGSIISALDDLNFVSSKNFWRVARFTFKQFTEYPHWDG